MTPELKAAIESSIAGNTPDFLNASTTLTTSIMRAMARHIDAGEYEELRRLTEDVSDIFEFVMGIATSTVATKKQTAEHNSGDPSNLQHGDAGH